MEWLWVFTHQYNYRAFNGDYYFVGCFHQCWPIHCGVSKFILFFFFSPCFAFLSVSLSFFSLFFSLLGLVSCLITCARKPFNAKSVAVPTTTTFSPEPVSSAGLHLPQTIQPRQWLCPSSPCLFSPLRCIRRLSVGPQTILPRCGCSTPSPL